MIVIGLTGGIGSGKSEVSRMLKEFGAEIIDADRVGHEAYLPNTETYDKVVAEFGDDILQTDGAIDRKKLGARIFAEPEARERLNAIVHPRMYAMVEERIQRLREQSATAVVLDAAILIEVGWDSLVDEVWVVAAPEEMVVQRIGQRNGLPAEQVRQRVRAQITSEERARHAAVVIDNNEGLDELSAQVQEVWTGRVKGRDK